MLDVAALFSQALCRFWWVLPLKNHFQST